MSSKRPHEESDTVPISSKKARKGFHVGPDNLPDGQHKRKAQQIKRNLIEKAKLKKEYAKVKARHEKEEEGQTRVAAHEEPEDPTTDPHPDRQFLIDAAQNAPAEEVEKQDAQGQDRRFTRRPKTVPFAKEHRQARRAKEEAEERRAAIEQAQRERLQKLEEREKFRRAMAKARTPGKDGKRKLGRESKTLLDKVMKMTT